MTTQGTKITALYERRDDESQGESNSIINQKVFLEDYAKRNSLPNIQHFTDDGVSGTTFDRKGFQAMIAEVEAGAVATIIVKDMSRFGRDYLKVGLYTDVLFKDKGVRFMAINNGIDSDKQGDNDFTPFLNIMNEWFEKVIVHEPTGEWAHRHRHRKQSVDIYFNFIGNFVPPKQEPETPH